MKQYDEALLKSIITLQGDTNFSRFINWISESKKEQMLALVSAKGELRDNLQGSIPELIEIESIVGDAKKLLNNFENLSNRKPHP